MKNIRLQSSVPVEKLDFRVSHDDPLLLVGSCFSENMGLRMADLRFDTMLNPFGIMYNPLSIAECLRRCIDNEPIDASNLVSQSGLWHSWLHHGAFSRCQQQSCLDVCNTKIHEAYRFLNHCRKIIITFGSANCYTLKETGLVVANCHKVSPDKFQIKLASVDEILATWNPLMERLTDVGFEVLFTISPVRHNAYGAHGNQLGKAALLLATEQLCKQFGASYFPAYEILVDELRDYRFYADDLSHPSTMAENIIWQRFQLATMNNGTIELCEQYERMNKQSLHRPLHTDIYEQ